jgi:hypothetical protein
MARQERGWWRTRNVASRSTALIKGMANN